MPCKLVKSNKSYYTIVFLSNLQQLPKMSDGEHSESEFYCTEEQSKDVALNFARDRVSDKPGPRSSREEIEGFVKEQKPRTQREKHLATLNNNIPALFNFNKQWACTTFALTKTSR